MKRLSLTYLGFLQIGAQYQPGTSLCVAASTAAARYAAAETSTTTRDE